MKKLVEDPNIAMEKNSIWSRSQQKKGTCIFIYNI
jgi:hypothetical protein